MSAHALASAAPPTSTTLTVGAAHDAFEAEADRLADRALAPDRAVAPPTPRAVATPTIRRRGEGTARITPIVQAATSRTGGGSPLRPADRAFFGQGFGRDLARVRIHDDTTTHRAAGDLRAQAFTIGQDVHFGRDFYRPETSDGRALLAHELAHTVQDQPTTIARRAIGRDTPDASPPATDAQQGAEGQEVPEQAGAVDAIVAALGADPEDRSGDARAALAAVAPEERIGVVGAAAERLGPGTRGALTAVALATEDHAAPAPRREPDAGPASPAATTRGVAARPLAGEQPASAPDKSVKAPTAGASSGTAPAPEAEPSVAAQAPDSEAGTAPDAATEGAGDTLPTLASLLTRRDPAGEASPSTDTAAPSVSIPDLQARIGEARIAALDRVGAALVAARKAPHAAAARARAAAGAEVDRGNQANALLFSQANKRLDGQLTSAHAQVETVLTARLDEFEDMVEDGKTGFADLFETHRETVEGVITETLQRVEEVRTQDVAYLTTRAAEQSRQARLRSLRRASKFPATGKGQEQADAVEQAGEQIAREIDARTPEAVAALDTLIDPTPAKIEEERVATLDGFDKGLPELQAGVEDLAVQVNQALRTTANAAHGKVEALGSQHREGLARAEAAAATSLAAILPQVDGQIAAALGPALRGVTAASDAARATIERFSGEAQDLLAGVTTPDPEGAEGFVAAVTTFLGGVAEETENGLPEGTEVFQEQMSHVGGAIRHAVGEMGKTAGAGIDANLEAAGGALDGAALACDDELAGSLASFAAVLDQGHKDAAAKLAPAVTTLRTKLERSVIDLETQLAAKIDEALAKNDEALAGLDAKLDDVEEHVGWDYDHYVLARARNVAQFIGGVLVGIIKVLAMVVAVLALALAVFVLVALSPFAALAELAATLVVVGFLLYGAYESYSARRKERVDGEQRGVLSSIGLGLVDMTGLTTVYRSIATPGLTPYERGKMFGEGGTTVVLTVFGARSAIGKFRGRVPPTVPEPGLIGETGAEAVPDAPPANDVAPAVEVPVTETPSSPAPGSPESVSATQSAPEANGPAPESGPANDTSVDPDAPNNVTPIERALDYRARAKAPQPEPVAQPRVMQIASGDNTTSLIGETVEEGGGRQAADPNAIRASGKDGTGSTPPQIAPRRATIGPDPAPRFDAPGPRGAGRPVEQPPAKVIPLRPERPPVSEPPTSASPEPSVTPEPEPPTSGTATPEPATADPAEGIKAPEDAPPDTKGPTPERAKALNDRLGEIEREIAEQDQAIRKHQGQAEKYTRQAAEQQKRWDQQNQIEGKYKAQSKRAQAAGEDTHRRAAADRRGALLDERARIERELNPPPAAKIGPPPGEPAGGAWQDMEAWGGERNHMPADSVSRVPSKRGPAIWMETPDHMQTNSWGANDRAIQPTSKYPYSTAGEWRAAQRELIQQGRVDEAIQMDIDDIQSKFGSKYDRGITQLLNYFATMSPGEF